MSRRYSLLVTLLTASIALFFLQALRVVFSVLFGIIYDQVFAGSPGAWLVISLGLALLAFAAPFFSPRRPAQDYIGLIAAVAAGARLSLSVNQAEVRFWGSLLTIAAAGLYLAAILQSSPRTVLPALLAALAADQTLRALGQTYDLGLRPAWLPLQAAWSLALVVAAAWWNEHAGPLEEQGRASLPWGLALGGLLFIESSLLSLPNAVARWAGGGYPALAASLFALTLLPALPGLRARFLPITLRSRWARLDLGALLAVGLLVGYFLPGLLGALGLLLAHAAAMLALAWLLDGDPGGRPAGPALGAGLLFLVFLNFMNAFAFTYPYALPFMRGLGWVVYLAAALAATWGVARQAPGGAAEAPAAPPAWAWGAALACLALVAWTAWPRSVQEPPAGNSLRAATYNMHYGYDKDWHFTLDEIAQTIADSRADIVALQEVDTGRMTSYGVDDALYLSRRLGMNVTYLPTVERLTGIAVLYRGPALNTGSRLLTSLQEQTGIIHVETPLEGGSLHAYGIWMGLSKEDTLTQIREALAFTGQNSPAVFGGDFNAEIDSPVAQEVQAAGFRDPFEMLGIPAPFTDPAVNPHKRIDFVWVRGASVAAAEVSPSLASDHRLVVVEVSAP